MPESTNTKFSSNVQAMLNNLPNGIKEINEIIGLSTIPLMTNRLIDEGKRGDGKPLGQYSDKPLSPLFFTNTGTGKGADTKVAAEVKRNGRISYKKYRELNNLPTDHVTLSFTGETLGDIGVLGTKTSTNLITTEVGSKNSKTKQVFNAKGKNTGSVGTGDVLDQLGERYGDILSLTKEEENAVTKIFDFELQKFIDRYL